MTRGGKLKVPGKLVHIDIDPKEIGKYARPNERCSGMPTSSWANSTPRSASTGAADRVLLEPVAGAAGPPGGAARGAPDGGRAGRGVRNAVPRDALLALDMTGCPTGFDGSVWPTSPTVLYPLTMAGWASASPCAIGAQVACPDRKVVAVCGDARLPVLGPGASDGGPAGQAFPIVIVNDEGYSALRPRQKRITGGW